MFCRRCCPLHILLLLCLFLFSFDRGPSAAVDAQRTQWDAFNFPNPTAPGDFHRCKMKSTALLCDPDEVLSEQERYRLNYELGLIETATRQENGRDFCERKGINAAIAIARQVKGGQEQDVRNMANDLLRRWTLDKQCEKAIVIVLSLEDRRFWVARMPRVPVYAQEFTELFKKEQGTFKAGRNSEGLQNVISAIRDRALSKQFPSARPDDDGRSKGTPFVPMPKPTPHPEGKQRQKGGGGGTLRWLLILLVIFFVVIPLACCCCCIYFCFFRKKDSGSNNRAPHNAESGGTGAERRGGSGLPLVGLLSGIGGAASNLFSKTRRRGGAADDGGAQPPPPPPYAPISQDDKKSPSLYPTIPVKDEGGGGSF